MLNYKIIPRKNRNLLTKIHIYIINFLILLNLISINISYYENNIITFDHKKFKAGNFATNKNGELFIEYYSEDDNTRLFYGRQKNGLELFFEQSSCTQEINIGLEKIIDVFGYNYFDIYNSKNLFVTIRNDFNKENQYLFSINSYDYVVELHKFTNNINTDLYLWNFNDFFHLSENEYEFPYEIMLFELKKEFSYIMAFIPKIFVNEDMRRLSFIKKFRFKTSNEDAYEEIKSIEFNNYINKTILSTFLMDDKFSLVVISLEKIEVNNIELAAALLRRIQGYRPFRLILNFYYTDLDPLELGDDNTLEIDNFNPYPIDDLFFKTIYLRQYLAVIVWISPWNYNENRLMIGLFKLSYLSGGYPVNVIENINIGYSIKFGQNSIKYEKKFIYRVILKKS